mgnify:CR=1 FL=1
MYTGENAILFLLTVDAPYRGKPRGCVNEHAHRKKNGVHGGRSDPDQDPDIPTKEIGSVRTTLKDLEKPEKGSAFMMRHEANSMKKTTPKSDEVWYVNYGASNHMIST